jgi:hypothetical protein
MRVRWMDGGQQFDETRHLVFAAGDQINANFRGGAPVISYPGSETRTFYAGPESAAASAATANVRYFDGTPGDVPFFDRYRPDETDPFIHSGQ